MSRQVWNWNLNEEMCLIQDCLQNYRCIAMDTEFPGCLRETQQHASDDERYSNMRFNVNQTKVIQLGISLFDPRGRIGGTWEINFSDFGDENDAKNEKSIDFLKGNGLDFEKIREEGVGIKDFFSRMGWILKQSRKVIWVTFHGSYDIAYLLKYFTGQFLPETFERFSEAVGRVLGSVYDLKVISSRVEGLSSRLGLESLARQLQLNRVGTAHHAGSDSELTARVFFKMVQIYHNVQESEGLVYGLGYRIISDTLNHKPHHIQHPVMMRRCYGPPPMLLHPPMLLMHPPPFPLPRPV